jgi:tRNA threonylcarbamoyladenosine biosynthesis protein TsaB
MIILTIRTDKPEAEIGLYDDQTQLAYYTWEAHRQLAESLHATIHTLIQAENYEWADLQGIVTFRGPGSFTGLRIGISVANALADSLKVPIVATEDPEWLEQGIKKILNGQSDETALPEYGAPVRITQQKK